MKDTNEIELRRRTLENNTYESIEDKKLKKITSWRKSQQKFFKNLIYNILSFGILHIISLFHPNLYIKLYCDPSPASECDYFLVENIYGKLTLCPNICRKKDIKELNLPLKDKEDLSTNNKKSELELTKTLLYSFVYKSNVYEYDEKKDEIIPVYMDLSSMTNADILDYFLSGLGTKGIVKKFRERYGKNEYAFNIRLLYLFFLKNEIPSYIIVIIICCIQTVAFNDLNILGVKILIVILFIFVQLINIKVTIINKYKEEFTLDGNKKKIKVKRKYLLKELDDLYIEIEPEELLPGDILFLKENDFVPCDCIIIEGECLANESNLTGKLDIYNKTSIKENKILFNYRANNINILYHGMKIIKTFSKINNNYISVLCINIGPNTYKANQYSNIFYFLERKKEYNYVYNLFGERKIIFYYIIIAIVISQLYGFIFVNLTSLDNAQEDFKRLVARIMLGGLSECLILPYFLTHSFMILLGIFRLQRNDIICFDKSRLINSGKINTIIFNKTGTLSSETIEINGYNIPDFNNQRKGSTVYKKYTPSQSKKLNVQLLNYYIEYFQLKEKINKKKNVTFDFNGLNSSESLLISFLECLISCTNVEKFEIDLFGNKLEKSLFNDLNWDIKPYSNTNNINENNKAKDNYVIKHNNNNNANNSDYILVKKNIYDIFPKNNYKLSESVNNSGIKQLNESSIISNKNNENHTLKRKNDINKTQRTFEILSDIYSSQTGSYKLRIIKKFLINGSRCHSTIVYNFIKKELRFMVKGYPEEIINKCLKSSLPDNLENVISINRKNGLIILICASKILDISNYDDSDELDDYMNDLIFCGFITLRNKIKNRVKYSIDQIKEFDCHMVISSADNEYNCLSAGFNSGLIENNNIFVVEKLGKYNKLFFRKVYSMEAKEGENIKEIKDFDEVSCSSKLTKITKNFDINKAKTKKQIFKSKLINNERENNFDKKNSLSLEKSTKLEDFSEMNRLEDLSNSRISGLQISKKNYDVTSNFKRSKKDFETLKKNKLIQDKKNVNIMNCFQDIEYYHGIFDDFDDLREGIYCISSAAFNFLYQNKKYEGIKYILEKLHKKSKIFFNMSSVDKSRLIDYFRESENNIVLTIGGCDSDLDSIISSNVGISLKNPPNQNMILCHFYFAKKDIINLKNLVVIGRLLYENSILLEIVSFSCAVAVNFYLAGCLSKYLDIKGFLSNQLRFLDLENLILEMISFVGLPKEKIQLIKNKKLLNIYYIVQLVVLLNFKLCSLILLQNLYTVDETLNEEESNEEYINFVFLLCVEFIITSIFAFNNVSFYRKSPFSNIVLVIISLLILLYIILLICLNSSNYNSDVINLTKYSYSDNLIDSISDRNGLLLLLIICFDFIATFLFSTIIYNIFNRYIK